MQNSDPGSLEPTRWAGFSHDKIFASVAGDRTSTESMHSVAAALVGKKELLAEALTYVEKGHAEYTAVGQGAAVEAGATTIGNSVESLRTLVQSSAVVPDVITKVAERFDTAKDVIGGLPPKTTSAYDPEDLPMSWVLPPPADQMDGDEINKRWLVRDAMAGYERDATAELSRLPAFVPTSPAEPAQVPVPSPVRQPMSEAEATVPVRSLMEAATKPIPHISARPTGPQSSPAPMSFLSGDFGPTGHSEEDAEYESQQSAGESEPEAGQRLPWRSDLGSALPATHQSTSLFESDEKTAPPVIGS